MSKRFTKEASRWGYHGCDQCMSVDADTIETKGRLDQMWTDGESGETLCTECKERREKGRTEDEKLVSSSDIEAAYRAELDAATERNGKLSVELAAVKLENASLRREVRQLAKQASIHCYQCQCCATRYEPVQSRREKCIECAIRRAKAEIKAAQAGKGEG